MPKRDFLVSIDLNQNELLQAVLQNFASIAALPDGTGGEPRTEGQLAYVAGTVHKPFYFDGTDWVDMYGGIEEISADGGLKFTSGNGLGPVVYLSVEADESSLEVSSGVGGVVRIKDSGVTTIKIADSNVTLAKLANIGTMKLIGNVTGGSATPAEVQIVTVINNDDDTSIPTEGAVYDYVNNAITALGALQGDWDASGTAFPSTRPPEGTGATIQAGDYWYITVAGTMGTHVTNVGDVLYAKVATPGQTSTNWFVVEANYYQASETEKGVAEIATQTEVDAGTDDLRIITPLKLKNWYLNGNSASSAEFIITGDNILTAFALTHNFNTTYVDIKMYEVTTGLTVEAEEVRTSADVVTINFNTAPAVAKLYHVTVIGSDNSL